MDTLDVWLSNVMNMKVVGKGKESGNENRNKQQENIQRCSVKS